MAACVGGAGPWDGREDAAHDARMAATADERRALATELEHALLHLRGEIDAQIDAVRTSSARA
eukprot:3397329-Prymnesium_polylepis.1